MGIKNLFKIISHRAPDQILECHLSTWRGHSFAVDISIFLNKYIKSAGPHLWMNVFFMFLCILKKHGIKCLCIFDGKAPPREKQREQASRREQLRKAQARLKRAIEIRKLIVDKYIPSDTPLSTDLQQECAVIIDPRKKLKNVAWVEATEVYGLLNDLINRLDKQTSPITDEHREKAWEIANIVGLRTYQSEGEAESLCAYLAIHGYVDAVLTEDTDVLAYGCPFMVAFKDYKLGDEKVRAIHLPSLLKAMDLDMNEFRDLCILLSCDYNRRVKGYLTDDHKGKPVPIGWKRALELIEEHRCLENIEPYIEDMSPLIYHRCRELFTPITTEEMEKLIETPPYNRKPDMIRIRQFLKDERLNDISEYIEKCWEPAVLVFHEEDKDAKIFEGCVPAKVNCVYAKLTLQCKNVTDELKMLDITVCFADRSVFDEACEEWFEPYLEVFGAWVNEHILSGYFIDSIDDIIECGKLPSKPDDVKILEIK